MSAVRVVDRQVAALAKLLKPLFEITLDHGFCEVMVAPVEQVGDREPLSGGLGRSPCERDGHVVLAR
jgi:hypothetical protein